MTVRRSLLGLWLLLLAAAPVAATSFVPVADEALADRARVAVVGRVVTVDPQAGARAGGGFATEYEVRVEEALKGGIQAGSLRVRVPGGTGTGGHGLRIHGAPELRVGERVILFLEPTRDGAYRPVHLFLGAFHEAAGPGGRFAVRDLSQVSEVRVSPDGTPKAQPPAPEPLRDFAAFARWIAARAAGDRRPADYRMNDGNDGDGELRRNFEKFTLFSDPRDRFNMRWFEFDGPDFIDWRAFETGQQGLPGGGYAELQEALKAWNADPETAIDFRYAGTTTSQVGFNRPDGVNAVLFNDPGDEVTAFDCAAGGVLALGGPFYEAGTFPYKGTPYHRIAEADVILNDGLDCFFARSPDAHKLAAELLTHELGHTLGLGHSCGDSLTPACTGRPALDDAVMRAFVHDDGRGARLGADDRAAIRVLYSEAPPPAAPTGLHAEALSPVDIKLTWKDESSDETEFRVELRTVDGAFEDVGAVSANVTLALVQGVEPATGYVFRIRASRGGVFSAYSNEAGTASRAQAGPCAPDPWTVCLAGGRFRARMDWTAGGSPSRRAEVMPMRSDGSGLFWFFSPDNLELLVKVLDGCAANGHHWVFAGSATTLQYVLTVTDTLTGEVRVYFNPLGTAPAAVTDLEAFGGCP